MMLRPRLVPPVVLSLTAVICVGLTPTVLSAAREPRSYTETTLAAGWNLIALDGPPANPDPTAVFAAIPLDGRLARYEADVGEYRLFSDAVPGDFGPLVPGEGYWLYLDDTCVVGYEIAGERPDLPFLVTLPSAGWHLIGGRGYWVETVNFVWVRNLSTNEELRMFFAWVDYRWLQLPFYYYDAEIKGYRRCVYGGGLWNPDTDWYIRPWKGYWVCTFEPDLALVFYPLMK